MDACVVSRAGEHIKRKKEEEQLHLSVENNCSATEL